MDRVTTTPVMSGDPDPTMPEFVERDDETCTIEGCDRDAAVRLDVPWEGLCDVCTAHARIWSQKEGVVAMPIEGADEEWSHGSGADREGGSGADGDGGPGSDRE